jgi:hypothetical protein
MIAKAAKVIPMPTPPAPMRTNDAESSLQAVAPHDAEQDRAKLKAVLFALARALARQAARDDDRVAVAEASSGSERESVLE